MSPVDEQPEVAGTTACASCGLPADAPGNTPLCTPCRAAFVAYPIPLWIKIFGGVLLCVLLFSLFGMSSHIQTGIHFKRGMKATEAKNYRTAEKEFQAVLVKEPADLDARCQLLVASFYNSDFNLFAKTSEALEKKHIDDADLLQEMQSLANRLVTYYPKDSFVTLMRQYNMETDSIPEAMYKTYLAAYPNDCFALSRLASVLANQNRQAEEDSVLNLLLEKDPAYYAALLQKASVKRERGQLDSSYYFINQLLASNHEDVTALALKARTLLKEKKDADALALARQTLAADEANAYSMATLAMAYHFNGKAALRDEVLAKAATDSSAVGIVQYVRDIVSGKQIFRN